MKIQMTVAAIIMVTFVASLASTTEYARTRTVVFLLVGAAAAGYVENLTLSTMALVWEAEDIGLVAGVLGSIRTALGAVAVSLYSSVLSNEVTMYLPEYVAPAATGAGLPAKSLPALFEGISSGIFTNVPGINPKILGAVGHAVKHAYAMSFQTVFLCTLPFGFLILVAAVISPNVEDYLTDDVARKLHGTGVAETPARESEKMEQLYVERSL
jgi:Na+-transporting NADH:ubiquinone oxidoreductase subunit NqrE